MNPFYFLRYFVRLLPLRLNRIAQHLQSGFRSLLVKKPGNWSLARVGYWWVEILVSLIELTGFSEIYESLSRLFKRKTRRLTKEESKLVQSVFGNSISLDHVRIDEKAYIACKQWHFCYVSFYTINSWGPMSPALLIHEMTHVWQYERLGAVYIPRALFAIHLKNGYNYGGASALKAVQQKGGTLLDFNLEQQAEIVSDYYRIREGWVPNWGNASNKDLHVYEYFVAYLNQINIV